MGKPPHVGVRARPSDPGLPACRDSLYVVKHGSRSVVRLDDEALRALGQLEATGLSRSDAIRKALVETASRLHDKHVLASEVAALESDEEDTLEMHGGRPHGKRLGDLAGHLTPEEQWGIDAAILTVLGLS
jgi:hypothetical protein